MPDMQATAVEHGEENSVLAVVIVESAMSVAIFQQLLQALMPAMQQHDIEEKKVPTAVFLGSQKCSTNFVLAASSLGRNSVVLCGEQYCDFAVSNHTWLQLAFVQVTDNFRLMLCELGDHIVLWANDEIMEGAKKTAMNDLISRMYAFYTFEGIDGFSVDDQKLFIAYNTEWQKFPEGTQ